MRLTIGAEPADTASAARSQTLVCVGLTKVTEGFKRRPQCRVQLYSLSEIVPSTFCPSGAAAADTAKLRLDTSTIREEDKNTLISVMHKRVLIEREASEGGSIERDEALRSCLREPTDISPLAALDRSSHLQLCACPSRIPAVDMERQVLQRRRERATKSPYALSYAARL